jgi:hypothetical protein
MSRRLALLVIAMLALSCGSPSPPRPTDRPTDGQPSGSPPDLDAGADMLAPGGQPALAGIYLPEGMVARGTDHYAFIQSPTDCETLAAVLGAGQWTLSERVAVVAPSPDPSAGIPPFQLPEWLLLRWASDALVVRLGGDSNGCVAQVWRLARLPYSASGAVESSGEAMALTLLCAPGGGSAELLPIYLADDGTAFTLRMLVPLELGRHAVDAETEVGLGKLDFDVDDVFRALAGQVAGAGVDEESFDAFYPADLEGGQWEGRVEVTALEPLTGEIVLENLQDERGRSLSLRAGFRCDLPPGQLTRAAEPTPTGSPAPAPGTVTVEISGGPHAGRHDISSAEVKCSYNISGDKQWLATYGPAEPPPAGELQSLLITTSPGAKASVFMIFGDNIDRDWIKTETATAKVTDAGGTVELDLSGGASGITFKIVFTCRDIGRF